MGDKYYFPIAMFKSKLNKTKEVTKDIVYTWNLLDEQKDILDIVKSWNRRSWLIEMKTWRWKSHIVIWLTAHFNEPTIIAVHNLSTLRDMVDKFREFTNITPAIYCWNKKQIWDVTITTHKSFVMAQDMFRSKFWVVIIDECDYNLSKDMIEAMTLCDADAIFWLSGTPKRKWLDIQDMEYIYGPHIKVLWQENNWYNLIPEVTRIEYYSSMTYSFWTWRHELKESILSDMDRFNQQCSYVLSKMSDGTIKYGLVLVERKEEECVKYYNELSKHIKCCIINWDTKIDNDQKNIEDIRSAWKWLIIGTIWKIGRGKDIPMLDWIFLFFPSRFENNTIQAVWRGLRNCPWKPKCLLIDWCDMPILAGQSKARVATYEQ